MGAGDRALSNRAVCKGESVEDDIEMHLYVLKWEEGGPQVCRGCNGHLGDEQGGHHRLYLR